MAWPGRASPRLAPCVARFPHAWRPAPAAKYTYIDAFNGKTVTRETLLRYTFKSYLVNVLIGGFLWKTSPPRFTLKFAQKGVIGGGIGVFSCGGSPRHRGMFLPLGHAETNLVT